MELVNAVDLIHGTHGADVFPLNHEDPRTAIRLGLAVRRCRIDQAQHTAQRHTDNKLSVHVYNAFDMATPLRQRVNLPRASDFGDRRGRQRQPLQSEAEDDDRLRGTLLGKSGLGEMRSGGCAVLSRGITIENGLRGCDVHGAVLAMRQSRQLRTGSVASDAYGVPAIHRCHFIAPWARLIAARDSTMSGLLISIPASPSTERDAPAHPDDPDPD